MASLVWFKARIWILRIINQPRPSKTNPTLRSPYDKGRRVLQLPLYIIMFVKVFLVPIMRIVTSGCYERGCYITPSSFGMSLKGQRVRMSHLEVPPAKTWPVVWWNRFLSGRPLKSHIVKVKPKGLFHTKN